MIALARKLGLAREGVPAWQSQAEAALGLTNGAMKVVVRLAPRDLAAATAFLKGKHKAKALRLAERSPVDDAALWSAEGRRAARLRQRPTDTGVAAIAHRIRWN